MLSVSGNIAAGYVEPVNQLRDDLIYRSAVELSEMHFTWHKMPSENQLSPMKRVIAREIQELMRRVQTWSDAKNSAKLSLSKAEVELLMAREELAAAVAAWPKDEQ